MKTKSVIAGLLAASIAAASAANYTTGTVGTVNGNGKTILEATGNSLNAPTFASDLATAYANNTGGVWDFDAVGGFNVAVGETITLNYGASLANSLVLTLGGGGGINQANTGSVEGTSGGPAGSMLGLDSNASTRTFALSTPLLTLGIFNTDRNDGSRIPFLTVTYLDTTTASTSGANANDYYFHGLSGTLANPIVSFSLSQSAFVRYDDLGFVVASVPEPSSMALAGLGLASLVVLRRRRN